MGKTSVSRYPSGVMYQYGEQASMQEKSQAEWQ